LILTGFDVDVSQLENSSQNAKNVVLLFLGEPEEPEGVLGGRELGPVVDAVDQRVLALGQVPELEKKLPWYFQVIARVGKLA